LCGGRTNLGGWNGRDDASGDGVAFGTTVPSGEVRAGRRGIDDIAGDAG
jgi:hypothetical protein